VVLNESKTPVPKDTNDWVCDLRSEGVPPTARFGHTAVASGSKIYIFGGQGFADNESNCSLVTMVSFNDLHCLDTGKMVWKQLCGVNMAVAPTENPENTKDAAKPSPRNSHTAVLIGDNMITFGGANADEGPMDDMWIFNLKSESWRKVKREHQDGKHPDAREMHSAYAANSKMYIMGGRMGSGDVCRDLWECDPDNGFKWTHLANSSSPRCSHGGDFLSSSKLLCSFGGWDGMGQIFDEITVFDLSQKKWAPAQLHGYLPTERFGHASCVKGDRLYIIGGVNASDDLKELVSVRPVSQAEHH